MTQSFADTVLLQWIEDKFGTLMIPFEEVAEEFFGWKTKKTALAKLRAGEVEKMGLIVTPTSETKVFVQALDLITYFHTKRSITISE